MAHEGKQDLNGWESIHVVKIYVVAIDVRFNFEWPVVTGTRAQAETLNAVDRRMDQTKGPRGAVKRIAHLLLPADMAV